MIWAYLITIPSLVTSIIMPSPAQSMQSYQSQCIPSSNWPTGVFGEYEIREPGPAPRLTFGFGAALYGYPSTGGVWIIYQPHPLVLQYLSLDRFTALPSVYGSDPVAEDAFCASMKKTGATWWPSLDASERGVTGNLDPSDGEPPDHVFTGWPASGGVWFLRLTDAEYRSSKVGMLAMALDMGEYCRVLEMNGAVFYADPKDCEYLKDVV